MIRGENEAVNEIIEKIKRCSLEGRMAMVLALIQSLEMLTGYGGRLEEFQQVCSSTGPDSRLALRSARPRIWRPTGHLTTPIASAGRPLLASDTGIATGKPTGGARQKTGPLTGTLQVAALVRSLGFNPQLS